MSYTLSSKSDMPPLQKQLAQEAIADLSSSSLVAHQLYTLHCRQMAVVAVLFSPWHADMAGKLRMPSTSQLIQLRHCNSADAMYRQRMDHVGLAGDYSCPFTFHFHSNTNSPIADHSPCEFTGGPLLVDLPPQSTRGQRHC